MMTENSSQPVSTELSRDLSLFHVTMMGVGMMVGAGVFLGIGNAIFHSGPGGVMLTFALNGLVAILTAMSYAELSSAIPRAGGAYNFARVAFGRRTSFIAGWMEWFASSIAGSAYAITFAIYLWHYLKGLEILSFMGPDTMIAEKVTAGLITLVFIYINYKGASEAGKIGAIIALGQTLFLALIGIAGIVIVIKDPSRINNFVPFMPMGWMKLFVTMGFTYVAFEGFEVIAQAGDETINPKQNLPKAMIYSVCIVSITYVAVAFATVVAVKAGSPGVDGEVWRWIGNYKEKGFGEAIARIMPFANLFLTVAVIFASTSALNATIFSATRAVYALGRDRMLPGFMAKIAGKTKTPVIALCSTGALLIFVAVTLNTFNVASTASIMFLFLFFLVNVCAIRIRRNMADEMEYGFMTPLFPLFPVTAIILQVIMVFHLHEVSHAALIIGPSWIVIGFLVFHFYSKKHAKATDDEIQLIEEEAIERDYDDTDYNVMVAVANPENALNMVRKTYNICGVKKPKIDLLHVVPVPVQLSLTDGSKEFLTGKEGIVEMMLYLAPLFPVTSSIRYCRSVSRGILSAVKEKKTDLLILGWHGREGSGEFSLGSTIDPIIERSKVNVIIFKEGGDAIYKNILVPVSGGANSAFALETATMLADKEEGKVTVLNVDTGRYQFDIDEFTEETSEKLSLNTEMITAKTIKSQDALNSILEQAEQYDMVVLGCTERKLIQQFWKPSFPEIVAQRCSKPVAIVKSKKGIRSWFSRLI